MPEVSSGPRNPMSDCIDACLNCQRTCYEVSTFCLEQDDSFQPDLVRLLFDCAEICQTSANFMSRGSHLHGQTCAACAQVCAQCAIACEQVADDPQLVKCAQVCRRCEEHCRHMAQVAA